MGELKGRGDANTNLENFTLRNFCLFIHSIFQAGFIQVLHHEVEAAFLFAQGEDTNDVGVCQRSGDLDLFKKFPRKGGIIAQIRS